MSSIKIGKTIVIVEKIGRAYIIPVNLMANNGTAKKPNWEEVEGFRVIVEGDGLSSTSQDFTEESEAKTFLGTIEKGMSGK